MRFMAAFFSRNKKTDALPSPDEEWRIAVDFEYGGENDARDIVTSSKTFHEHEVFEPDREEENSGLLVVVSDDHVPLPFDLAHQSLFSRLVFKAEMRLLDLRDSLAKDLARERELGSLFNFVPVCLSLGIGAYFLAASEPSLIVLAGSFLFFAAVALTARSRGVVYGISVGLCLFFAGMSAAKLQVLRSIEAVASSEISGILQGTILNVDQNQRGAPRYLVRPSLIEGLGVEELPDRVRVSASKKHEPLKIGDGIEGLFRLQPISGPAYPGGYDFSFTSRIDGMGMSGFTMGAPNRINAPERAGIPAELKAMLERGRQFISTRIRSGLPGEAGDIATALITGDRSGLSEATQENLRRSGLAHILAISGLHMALVTLTVIWIIRFLLVLIPGFTDRYPAKKIAISAGFATATLYLLLSGMGIATQRAWLMISVMLAGSLMDRRAITMRSVAIAAIVILILSPASLFQPGFQMSFAAVAALVAVYQEWTRQQRIHKSRSHLAGKPGLAKSIGSYFGGLAATSLIAGTATALFAMWHFHRVAPMGLVSNLVAMPLVSLLVMPLSLLSMFLMPYGYESLALAPLGKSIEAVLGVSEWVNSYEYDFETGQMPVEFLVLATALLVFTAFLRTKLRFLAILPLVGIFIVLNQKVHLPDLLIAQDGSNIAIRTGLLQDDPMIENTGRGNDGLTLLYPRKGKFVTDIWRRAYLPNRKFDISDEAACSKDICTLKPGGKILKVVHDPDLLAEACASTDILIAPRLWWVNCGDLKPELVITRSDLESGGSHAITGIGKSLQIVTAWPKSPEGAASRPWHNRIDIVGRKYPRRLNSGETPSNLPKFGSKKAIREDKAKK